MIHYYPDLSPTPKLAYVVGALRGDGSVRQGRITLDVRDKDFADEFARGFSSVLNVEMEPKRYEKWNIWHVSKRSKLFYDWFISLPPAPEVIERFPREYLRGLFDADGLARTDPNGPAVEVRLTNTNLQLVITAKRLLEKIGISSRLHLIARRGQEFPSMTVKNDIYSLSIAKVESAWRFWREIGFTIRRKNQILANGLREFIEKPRTIEIYDKAMELRKRGMGDKRISKELGLSLGTVGSWLYQGVEPHSYRLVKEMREEGSLQR